MADSARLETSHGRGKQCKALGCTTLLEEGCSRYLLKKRLCATHFKAEAVRCKHDPQTLYRYCQQCGKLEELSRFQGTKRSCKSSLQSAE
ncbi:hypothetical protein OEZ85_008909 [Tetradesmus obliquus]|uniref:SBP-type domain-containing protein n=1 Tax=Tetradesmus obliquus TaxID=3088 RepID=A0ABY8TPW5_TETOB|nr:hypothetical protein OEZ85_008909 [Tetradesmus obliquus]